MWFLERLILKRLLLLLVWGLVCGVSSAHAQTSTPPPKQPPIPSQVLTDGRNASLALYFDTLKQGGIGVLHLYGEGITDARAQFVRELWSFVPANDGLYLLLPIGIDLTARQYVLSVSVGYADRTRTLIETLLTVSSGGYGRQEFIVPPDKAYLIAPEIERLEYAHLSGLIDSTPALPRAWDEWGFSLPSTSEITSAFGFYRTLNNTTQTRHTGWDFRAVPGSMVVASAGGEVVYADALDIRGNYVFIHHGYGVFSGYAHLSQFLVTRGQTIQRGQAIGLSGNTGRSNGPHLHWEVNVNGKWVDGVQLTEMWLP